MEEAGSKMEEIYALPPKLKYNESWLQLKEKKGFTDFWVVLKGTYIFFFKDQNTHAKEQHVGYLIIEVQQTKCTPKKGSSREFMVEMGKKKYQFRANDDILRRRWIHAIKLVNRADAPGPLPGDPDFKELIDFTPSPDKMKKRSKTIHAIPQSQLPTGSPTWNDDLSTLRSVLRNKSLDLSHPIPELPDETTNNNTETYDHVFVPPSWYYSSMSRKEAEEILSDQPVGSYLLRDTKRNISLEHYALSIKDLSRTKHHRIVPRSDGKCYFDSSPDAPFPSPIQAVEYLMRKTYPHLISRPVCGQDRRSGDGQEEKKQLGSPRESADRKMSDNPYMASPNSINLDGSKSSISSNGSSSVFPSSPGLSPDMPSPTPFSSARQRKANSLPVDFSMKGRPLPDLPDYANDAAIQHFIRQTSYVNVEATWIEDEDVLVSEAEAEVPPPLPRKKNSLPARFSTEHTYENLPFHWERQGLRDRGNSTFEETDFQLN